MSDDVLIAKGKRIAQSGWYAHGRTGGDRDSGPR
jgi:hypothetical protein